MFHLLHPVYEYSARNILRSFFLSDSEDSKRVWFKPSFSVASRTFFPITRQIFIDFRVHWSFDPVAEPIFGRLRPRHETEALARHSFAKPSEDNGAQ